MLVFLEEGGSRKQDGTVHAVRPGETAKMAAGGKREPCIE